MPPWLTRWIARWASGERFRKATLDDYRFHFAPFFFFGMLMVIVEIFGRRSFEYAGPLCLWICITVAMCASVFGCIAWARRVPAMVSLLLGALSWGVFA